MRRNSRKSLDFLVTRTKIPTRNAEREIYFFRKITVTRNSIVSFVFFFDIDYIQPQNLLLCNLNIL
jgi:hypothetical protein